MRLIFTLAAVAIFLIAATDYEYLLSLRGAATVLGLVAVAGGLGFLLGADHGREDYRKQIRLRGDE